MVCTTKAHEVITFRGFPPTQHQQKYNNNDIQLHNFGLIELHLLNFPIF